ncbi:MAG: ETC complex I subunit [Paracoccaceae bacterium]|nr:ETC complex I subunit [Paracoccaceae bacterium]
MLARIFKRGKSSMQSGPAKANLWFLEFDTNDSKKLDPLMGWTGSSGTQGQVRLKFESKQDAIIYAEKHSLAYTITENEHRKPVIRKNGYGENFATNRKISWTH